MLANKQVFFLTDLKYIHKLIQNLLRSDDQSYNQVLRLNQIFYLNKFVIQKINLKIYSINI